jgi:hypothetical protein
MSVGGFEIDFLWFTALIFDEFRTSVDSLFRWAEGMNDAAYSHGVSIQYCMDLPSYALASMEFGAVTNARASDDNFPWGEDGAPRHYRWKIAYGALLYNAMGLQPFMDVIWTQAEQPHNIANQGKYAKRTNIDLQATVAAMASRRWARVYEQKCSDEVLHSRRYIATPNCCGHTAGQNVPQFTPTNRPDRRNMVSCE